MIANVQTFVNIFTNVLNYNFIYEFIMKNNESSQKKHLFFSFFFFYSILNSIQIIFLK